MVDLRVYDTIGREIHKSTSFRTKGEHSEMIDFSMFNVSSGAYMIRVSSSSGDGKATATVKAVYIK